MQQTKTTTTTRDAGVQATLDGIHALYIRGKITLEQHNSLCFQANNGATSFEL